MSTGYPKVMNKDAEVPKARSKEEEEEKKYIYIYVYIYIYKIQSLYGGLLEKTNQVLPRYGHHFAP